MGENQFSRELRLLTPTHFQQVFEKATPAVSPQLTLLARANSLHHPRLGITIAKKKVRKAHERNRLKRLIRESFRLNQHQLPPVDIIAIGKTNLDTLSNQEISTLLGKLWKKLSRRCATQS